MDKNDYISGIILALLGAVVHYISFSMTDDKKTARKVAVVFLGIGLYCVFKLIFGE